MLTRRKAALIVAHTLVGILIYSVWFCLAPRPVRDFAHLTRITRIDFPASARLIKGTDQCLGGTREGILYATIRVPMADLPTFLNQPKMSVCDESANALDPIGSNFRASCAVEMQKQGFGFSDTEVSQTATFANGSHTFLWVVYLNKEWATVSIYYDEP